MSDSDNVTTLSVVGKPRASDQARKQAVELLTQALSLAQAGEISELILILDHPDNSWSESMTNTANFPAAIGRLEMVKQSWVEKYLAQARSGRPLG